MAEPKGGEDTSLVLGLKVDVDAFKKEWKNKYSKDIQKVIGDTKFSINVDVKGLSNSLNNVRRQVNNLPQLSADKIIPKEVLTRYDTLLASLRKMRMGKDALSGRGVGRHEMPILEDLKPVQKQIELTKKQLYALYEMMEKLRREDNAPRSINNKNKKSSLDADYARQEEEANKKALATQEKYNRIIAERERRMARIRRDEDALASYAIKRDIADDREASRNKKRAETQITRERERQLKLRQKEIEKQREENRLLSIEARTLNDMIAKRRVLQQRLAKMDVSSPQFKSAQGEIQRLTSQIDLYSQAQRGGAISARKHNEELKRQSGLLNGLPQYLNAYISILGAVSFVRNVTRVTSEFELQRVALRSILQDAHEADALFAKTVAFAVQSPFKVNELVAYTKQLSAYRIESEKLFDTTKMLADVSAGLGVGMDRLILAYGQIRAASVLRGTELRQLTEAGIPIIDLLAKKFTDLRGEIVSTADVFELISERAVPFKMVEEVFRDMTSESGIFYEMQRKQAQTLRGIYSNLGDSFTIMFNEIGDEQRGVLVGVASALKSIADNWRVLDAVVVAGIPTWAVYQAGLKLDMALTAKATIQTKLFAKGLELEAAGHRKAASAMMEASVASNGLRRSLYRLKAALLSHPITALLTAVTALGVGIYKLVTYESDFDRLINKVKATVNESKATADAQIYSLEKLMEELSTATQGSKKYEEIVRKINHGYGDFIGKNLSVADSYDKIKDAVKGVSSALLENAQLGSYNASMETINAKFVENTKDIYTDLVSALRIAGVKITPEIKDKIKQIGASLKSGTKEWEKILDSIKPEGTRVQSPFIGVSAVDLWTDVNSVIKKFEDSYNEMLESQRKLKEEQEFLFGGESTIAPDLEKETARYNQAIEKLNATKATTAEYQKEEKLHLETMLNLYESAGLYGVKAANKIREALKLLNDEGLSWRKTVDSIVQQESLVKFKYAEDDDFFKYIDRIRQQYAKLKKDKEGLVKDNGGNVKALLPANKLSSINKDLATMEKIASKLGFLLETPTKGRDLTSQRQQQLKAEIDTIKKAYEQYKSWADKIGEGDAMKKVGDAFQPLFDSFEYLSGRVPKSLSEVNQFLDEAYKLAKERGFGSSKFLFDLGTEKGSNDLKEASDILDKQLKLIQEKFSRSKDASNFMKGLLASGMDDVGAMRMTMDIYGVNPQDIRKSMEDSFREAFKEKMPVDVQMGTNIADIEKQIKDSESKIGKDNSDFLLKLLNDIKAYDVETINSLKNSLLKFSQYQQKRTAIHREAIEERRRIDEMPELSEAQKKAMKDASVEKERKELDKMDYEDFKQSDLYVRMFEDLDKASTSMLYHARTQLQEMQKSLNDLDPAQLKEIQSRFDAIEDKIIERDPFKSLKEAFAKLRELREEYGSRKEVREKYTRATENEFNAKKSLKDSVDELALLKEKERSEKATISDLQRISDLQNSIIPEQQKQVDLTSKESDKWGDVGAEQERAWDKAREAAGNLGEKSTMIGNAFGFIRDTMAEFGVDMETSALGATLGDLQNVFSGAGDMMTGFYTMNPAQMIQGAVSLAQGFAGIFTGMNRKVAKANKIIKEQKKIIDDLEVSFKKLERTADKSLGSDLIQKTKEQQRNLEQQAKAYQKMYDAEMSKGKKKDEEKLKEYKNSLRDTMYEIEDLRDELLANMAGSDLTSAAQQFAQSWLNAYKTFDSTVNAIENDFSEMIDNLIVNALAARIVQGYLKPVFDSIEGAMNSGSAITVEEIGKIVELAGHQSEGLEQALQELMNGLNSVGVNVRKGESNLTGISASVANMTEDTALTLGAIGNNLVYYVVSIHDLLQAHYAGQNPTGDEGLNLISIQQSALKELRAIQNNTARNALAAEQLVSMLSSVVSPNGTSSTRQVNVRLR